MQTYFISIKISLKKTEKWVKGRLKKEKGRFLRVNRKKRLRNRSSQTA